MNRSDLPVTNVYVSHDPANTLGEGVKPYTTRIHSIGPGGEVVREIGTTSVHDALGYPGRVREVSFTDHRGVRWLRDDKGIRRVERRGGDEAEEP